MPSRISVSSLVNLLRSDSNAQMILKRGLFAFVVVLFFCDIAIYLSLAVSPYLEPQYWVGLLVVLAAILAWFSPRTRWEVLLTPVFFWCVGFLALTLIFFAAVPTSHIEQLKERVRDAVLLTTFLGVFLMLQDDLNFARKLVLLVVLLGVVLNAVSMFHNGFMRPLGVTGFPPLPGSIPWAHRSAGFYSNPNESAVALVLGMIMSIGILPRHWRVPFAIFVLVGVGATFSREGVAGWLITVACLCAFGFMRWRALIIYLVVLVFCAVLLSLAADQGRLLSVGMTEFYGKQIERFFGVGVGFLHDDSAITRWEVLKLGWVSFLEHPLIGNGIGSTYHWRMPISTHNIYLLYMDDYGIIGLFLYPALIWCMVHDAVGKTRKLVWAMAIFLLFWGLFDHNIVQNYYSLFTISLTAAMSRISIDESHQKVVLVSVEEKAD